MIISIHKNKIPKQYSYVLKTKQLEEILLINNINIHIYLDYCFNINSIGYIFWAYSFWLPNKNYSNYRISIRAGAVSKENIFIAREKMEENILPEFKNWIMNILSMPKDSTYLWKDLYFNAIFKNNILKINYM